MANEEARRRPHRRVGIGRGMHLAASRARGRRPTSTDRLGSDHQSPASGQTPQPTPLEEPTEPAVASRHRPRRRTPSPAEVGFWARHRKRLLLGLTVWLLAAVAIVVGPDYAPRPWLARAPGLADASTRTVGLILLILVTLAVIAVWMLRRDDYRTAVVGRTPELRASSYQKLLGGTVAVLVALIAVFGVLTTVESTVADTNNQLRAQEQAQLNDRFQAAAQMLGDDAASVRAAGITALAAIADDWATRATRYPDEKQNDKLRRDQCIETIEAYLKTPLPPDDTDDDPTTHSPAWEQERTVRQLIYKVISDHLRSKKQKCDDILITSSCVYETASSRSGQNWGDHLFDFSHAYLPEAAFSGTVFQPAGADFSSTEFSGSADLSYIKFGSTSDFSYVRFDGGADFSYAQFDSSANFSNAQFFDGHAPAPYRASVTDFSHTHFNGSAIFLSAHFFTPAHFVSAQLKDGAYFPSAIFQNFVDFSSVQFYGGTYFSGTRFLGETHFYSARFGRGACAKTKGGITLCDTDFSGASFANGVPVVPGLQAAAENQAAWNEGSRTGSLVAKHAITISTDTSGKRCQLINNTDHDVPIPDLPLVCG